MFFGCNHSWPPLFNRWKSKSFKICLARFSPRNVLFLPVFCLLVSVKSHGEVPVRTVWVIRPWGWGRDIFHISDILDFFIIKNVGSFLVSGQRVWSDETFMVSWQDPSFFVCTIVAERKHFVWVSARSWHEATWQIVLILQSDNVTGKSQWKFLCVNT